MLLRMFLFPSARAEESFLDPLMTAWKNLLTWRQEVMSEGELRWMKMCSRSSVVLRTRAVAERDMAVAVRRYACDSSERKQSLERAARGQSEARG